MTDSTLSPLETRLLIVLEDAKHAMEAAIDSGYYMPRHVLKDLDNQAARISSLVNILLYVEHKETP